MTKRVKIMSVAISISILLVIVALSIVLPIFLPRHGAKNTTIFDADKTKFDINDYQYLDKKEGEEFKILQLNDLQYSGNKGVGIEKNDSGLDRSILYQDMKSKLDKLIKNTSPDLLILPGDVIWGNDNDKSLKMVASLLDSYKIPWAMTFGNHDAEGRADKNYLCDILTSGDYKYCMFKRGYGNITGQGNYIINIKENGKIVESLIFLDAGEIDTQGVKGQYCYPYIDKSQMEWVKWSMENISKYVYGNSSEKVKSMLITHQAPVTLREYYENNEKDDNGVLKVPSKLGFGEFREVPGAYAYYIEDAYIDWDIMARDLGTTHIILGHDHINSAVIKLNGLTYCYGLKTGMYSYSNQDMQGATLYSLNNDVKVEHIYYNN